MNDDRRTVPAWIEPQWPAPANVRALSTLRSGGTSTGAYASLNLATHVGDDEDAVRENRQRLRRSAALPAEPLWLEQVHGVDVVRHDGAADPEPRADAAVAFEPGRVCTVMTADCLPVVIADRAGTRIGVAHAGWRGLANGVLEATVDALSCPPEELLAWLGPAISQPAFEVGAEVRDAFVTRHPSHASAFAPNERGRFQADLYLLAQQTLQRTGVGFVAGGNHCTCAEKDLFFSYRRDGGRTGRIATIAWLDA